MLAQIVTEQTGFPWDSIGAVAAVVSVIIAIGAIYFGWRFTQRKRLVYEIVAVTPLLSIDSSIKSRVRILYDDKDIRQAHLIIVRVENIGNTPIRNPTGYNEYERPINFSLGEKAQILTTQVTETNPRNLKVDLTYEKNKITVGAVLLNQGDWLKVEVLVAELSSDEVIVDWRIEGVREITRQGKYFLFPLTLNYQQLINVILSFFVFLTISAYTAWYSIAFVFSIFFLFLLDIYDNTKR